ncbi:MAG: hypothetical protein ABEI74_00910 [Candidatus Pacearchaeota archaeon]
MLDSELEGSSFEDLIIPLQVTAFDIENREEVVFSRGMLLRLLGQAFQYRESFFL